MPPSLRVVQFGLAQALDKCSRRHQRAPLLGIELGHRGQQPLLLGGAAFAPSLDAVVRQRKQDLPAVCRMGTALDQPLAFVTALRTLLATL